MSKDLENLSDEDRTFLDKASQFLSLDKYGDFLLRWARAIEAYGTPRDFVYSTYYEQTNVNLDGKLYPMQYFISENNAQRGALMNKQKAEAEARKTRGEKPRWPNDGNIACFLCDNIGQAISRSDNIVYDLGIHLILPNKYPSQFGHSLFVPKEHDDETKRVTPQQIPEERATLYAPEEGKTRGNILTRDYLDAVIESCDKYHLFGVRNHVLDGMSIPGHDHFHIFPQDLPISSLVSYVTKAKRKTEFGPTIYLLENTPFDTLLIQRENRRDVTSVAISLLEKMERDNQVFTLTYNRGQLFVSPRNREQVNNKRIQIGAGVPTHFSDTKGEEFLQRLDKFVPKRGEYSWEKYM